MSTASDVNISLEQHLVETLEPLVPVLPDDISADLSAVLGAASNASHTPSSAPPPPSAHDTAWSQPLIRHSLLSTISTWTRTAEGRKALTSHRPPLDPNSYAMVALLAGTRTSPEKKFPVVPVPIPGADARKELNDRRAVTAVFNALLSIFGAGAATWWAADRLRWKDEWKALLALAAAIVVASSEAILYLIWSSRRSNSTPRVARGTRKESRIAAVEGSSDSPQTLPESSQEDNTPTGMAAHSSEGVQPPASPAMQEHRTAAGLRERKQRSVRAART
ncbi:hypothetical protein PHLGIDRAFT_361177 [Phlebiopsis gigantea 11061_1 CR5-6]|uniref:Endoplasmic reticulum-based factor for assembly of V-ATPase n=1 Tax=Phlebiopsis gigantea (strain 11061_1 CR5-6) TaxID=745531 RepID=A0A0C3SA28_PHLG1|nr:hypothetical protein PHLGIDRAFT_361177 [Phlebiopsis gigantea 11061_1 CR5-6]